MPVRAVVVSLEGDVLELTASVSNLEIIGFIDANRSAFDSLLPNLGTDESWPELKARDPSLKVILAVDPPSLRRRLSDVYGKSSLLTVISPHTLISPTAEIGNGTLIQSRVLVSRNVRLGHGVKVNCGVALHHDTEIGDYSTIGPLALLLGKVTVGKECYIGAGAIIMARRSIGDGSTVGAGAVVTRDVAPGSTVVGIPARRQ